jgi:hypothetical protein
VNFVLIAHATPQKISLQLLYVISNTNLEEKKKHEVHRQIKKVLLIKVTLPPFDKYIIFHPAKHHSIFSIMPSQIDLTLNEASTRRPRYFIGRKETLPTWGDQL